MADRLTEQNRIESSEQSDHINAEDTNSEQQRQQQQAKANELRLNLDDIFASQDQLAASRKQDTSQDSEGVIVDPLNRTEEYDEHILDSQGISAFLFTDRGSRDGDLAKS
jgi:hypothetical protein